MSNPVLLILFHVWSESSTKLYEIEVLKEKGSQVKVHYTGYGSEYDEWKEKSDVIFSKPAFPSDVEQPIPSLTHLACVIKKRLLPSRSDDPEVRIQMPCDQASFNELKERGVCRSGGAGSGKYTISSYQVLDDVFGEKWHYRIANLTGDFS